jgi:hypothetical protein
MKYEARGAPATETTEDVLRLWTQRPAGGNEELFRWAYLTNPVGTAHTFLLHAVDGEQSKVVGSVGIEPRRVDVAGQCLTAGLLGDFFVEKAHRTFFPALTLQRGVLSWARKQFDLVYGFPNDSATPLIKKLGFRQLAHFQRRVLVLRYSRYIGSRLGSKVAGSALAVGVDGFRRFVHPRISWGPPRGLTFDRIDTVDERFDELFAKRAFQELTVNYRDAKLLKWRFLERPDQKCVVYTLAERASRKLRAYAVVHIDKDMAHVRDLLGVDFEAMVQVLLLVAGAARRRGCAALSFVCSAPPDVCDRLERLGFRVREGTKTLYGHTGDALANTAIPGLERWYATDADEDQ